MKKKFEWRPTWIFRIDLAWYKLSAVNDTLMDIVDSPDGKVGSGPVMAQHMLLWEKCLGRTSVIALSKIPEIRARVNPHLGPKTQERLNALLLNATIELTQKEK